MSARTIAVDSSALMAILLDEPEADRCAAALETAATLLISAGTVAECLIVAARRNIGEEMAALLAGAGFEIAPVTERTARRVAAAYGRWGKGAHPAGLNFGDCFAYALAEQEGCPLLYVGEDFARTGIAAAL